MAHSTLHAAYQLIIRITLAAGVTTLLLYWCRDSPVRARILLPLSREQSERQVGAFRIYFSIYLSGTRSWWVEWYSTLSGSVRTT